MGPDSGDGGDYIDASRSRTESGTKQWRARGERVRSRVGWSITNTTGTSSLASSKFLTTVGVYYYLCGFT